ncbi:MAG: hypothetical protein AAF828_10140 [Bacteroidota bacterium]
MNHWEYSPNYRQKSSQTCKKNQFSRVVVFIRQLFTIALNLKQAAIPSPATWSLAEHTVVLATERKVPPPAQPATPPSTTPTPSNQHNWKVFVFFLPGSGKKPPKPPNGKTWLEIILLVVKVAAAIFALVKTIGLLG